MSENNNEVLQQRLKIISLLKEKAVIKQDIFNNTIKVFDLFRQMSKSISSDLKNAAQDIDKRIGIAYTEVNQFAYQLKVAGDTLEFFMHTNIFEIDRSSPIYKSPYVKQNPMNAYCGILYVYNFMSDSFKFNRLNDLGLLIARIFINHENRFFIESKTSIGSKYGNFSLEPINESVVKEILNELVIFSIQFDLVVPPIDAVKDITVNEINERTGWITLRTGKRLGFSASGSSNEDDVNFQL